MAKKDSDQVYIGILEAVVAVLAIRCGVDPKTMMAKAIEDITEAAGMETVETERVIRSRWQGRNLQASALVAKSLVTRTDEEQALRMPETAEKPNMESRLQGYKKRLSVFATENLS